MDETQLCDPNLPTGSITLKVGADESRKIQQHTGGFEPTAFCPALQSTGDFTKTAVTFIDFGLN